MCFREISEFLKKGLVKEFRKNVKKILHMNIRIFSFTRIFHHFTLNKLKYDEKTIIDAGPFYGQYADCAGTSRFNSR